MKLKTINDYEEYILNTMKVSKYQTGMELTKNIEKKFSITSSHARKIIQRAVEKNIIESSSPITFGKGQFVYFSTGKYLSKEMILKITKVHRPPLYRLISMMDLNGGIISYYEGLKISASPLTDSTKTDTLDKMIIELEHLQLVSIYSDSQNVKYLIHPSLIEIAETLATTHYSKMKVDAMFILDILRSLTSFNIIGNTQALYRNKTTPSLGVIHNNFVWDSIAYTKTTGINNGKASISNTIDKQTLVVLDIVINRPYSDHDLQGFYSRIQSVLNSVKDGKRKILPIIVYTDVEDQIVYNTIHKLGFLTFDLGTIYGSKILSIVQSLKDLQFNQISKDDSFNIDECIEKSLAIIKESGQDINLGNIKGDLFESLMYSAMQTIFSNAYIQPGHSLKHEKKSYEYDFIVNTTNEIIIIEVKGYNSNIRINIGDNERRNTIKWFFENTYPIAKNILKNNHGQPKITGCYITSAGFYENGIEYLNRLNEGRIKPTKLDTWYDRAKLFDLLQENNLTKTKNIIERYYSEQVTKEKTSRSIVDDVL